MKDAILDPQSVAGPTDLRAFEVTHHWRVKTMSPPCGIATIYRISPRDEVDIFFDRENFEFAFQQIILDAKSRMTRSNNGDRPTFPVYFSGVMSLRE